MAVGGRVPAGNLCTNSAELSRAYSDPGGEANKELTFEFKPLLWPTTV